MKRFFSSEFLNNYKGLITSSQIFEKYLPRSGLTEDSLKWLLPDVNSSYDLESIHQGISKPTWDMLERGGKMWRGALCLISGEALGAQKEELLPLAASVELIHNGSLICDDIEDSSEYRRGRPCTHKVFGVDVAINAGNLLYFLPLKIIKDMQLSGSVLKNIFEAYSEEMVHIHFGQCSDIVWNNSDFTPSEDQYFTMVSNKTSVLSRLAVKFALYYTQQPQETQMSFIEFADKLGKSFQVLDDVINLESEEYAKGRSYLGEDITEGKKTLIVIRALSQTKEARRLKEILSMRTKNPSLVEEALGIIKSTDAIDYAKSAAQEMVESAWSKLDPLLQPSEAKTHLHLLSQLVVNRSS